MTEVMVKECIHLRSGQERTYMVRGEEHLCLDCAAVAYELGDMRYQPAWLLVHGRELDKQSGRKR